MTNDLDNFRNQIDLLDDKIIALLKERSGIVKKVGDYKRETAPDAYPLRPGREAKMLKRIAEVFKGSDFSPAAAAQIWRVIIGASTAIESKLTVSVFAPTGEQDYYWLAREYFGPAATLIKQPHIKRVISDVLDGTASIGVVPVFSRDDESSWWTNLISTAKNAPKIFAHLPYALTDDKNKMPPTALAFGKLAPEDSGDDVSVYVLEMDHDVSQHKLQTCLSAENITASWISVTSLSPNVRAHLLSFNGFVAPDDKAFMQCLASLGASVHHVHFLGAYAAPFIVKE